MVYPTQDTGRKMPQCCDSCNPAQCSAHHPQIGFSPNLCTRQVSRPKSSVCGVQSKAEGKASVTSWSSPCMAHIPRPMYQLPVRNWLSMSIAQPLFDCIPSYAMPSTVFAPWFSEGDKPGRFHRTRPLEVVSCLREHTSGNRLPSHKAPHQTR